MMPEVMRRILCIGFAAIIPATGAALLHPKRPRWGTADAVTEVELSAVPALAGRILWVDARSKSAYDEAHIPSALPLTLLDWETQIDTTLDAWTPEHAVVVYCGGNRCETSRDVAGRLKRDVLPGNKVYVLKGGWAAWQQRL